jgi:hypothetical protein
VGVCKAIDVVRVSLPKIWVVPLVFDSIHRGNKGQIFRRIKSVNYEAGFKGHTCGRGRACQNVPRNALMQDLSH